VELGLRLAARCLKILDLISGMLISLRLKAFLHHQQDLFSKSDLGFSSMLGTFAACSEEIFHILGKKVDAIMKGQANVREALKNLGFPEERTYNI